MAFIDKPGSPIVACGIGRLRESADILPAGRDQSIFISHGAQDTLIPLEDGRTTRDILVSHGYAQEYREYEMTHEITGEVPGDLANWLPSHTDGRR